MSRPAHGRDKEVESDDPMFLTGTAVPAGDPAIVARCLIEEYARMGVGREGILDLFRDPNYRTHALWLERGPAWVERLVDDRLARTGVTRAVTTDDGPGCVVHTLMEQTLTEKRRATPEGTSSQGGQDAAGS